MVDYFPDTPHVYLPATDQKHAPKRWILTQECTDDLKELKKTNIATWQELIALMSRYAREGAPTSGEDENGNPIASEYELDAPVGDRFRPKIRGPRPWLGELRIEMHTKEIGGGKHYRLYFGDLCDVAEEAAAQMLAISGGEKWTSNKGADQTKVTQRQNHDIEQAMKRIIHWCSKNSRTYRELGN